MAEGFADLEEAKSGKSGSIGRNMAIEFIPIGGHTPFSEIWKSLTGKVG
jgi:hypothetical protein